MTRGSFHLPTSNEEHRAPRARKNEYMVIVRMKIISRFIKNCEGVRARFAMLNISLVSIQVVHPVGLTSIL